MNDDLISRQAAIEATRKLPNAGIHWLVSAEAVFDALLKLPSAQPQRIGHWISVFDEDEDKCSECQATFFCASTRF